MKISNCRTIPDEQLNKAFIEVAGLTRGWTPFFCGDDAMVARFVCQQILSLFGAEAYLSWSLLEDVWICKLYKKGELVYEYQSFNIGKAVVIAFLEYREIYYAHVDAVRVV